MLINFLNFLGLNDKTQRETQQRTNKSKEEEYIIDLNENEIYQIDEKTEVTSYGNIKTETTITTEIIPLGNKTAIKKISTLTKETLLTRS